MLHKKHEKIHANYIYIYFKSRLFRLQSFISSSPYGV